MATNKSPLKILNFKNLNVDKYIYKQPHKSVDGTYTAACTYKLSKNEMVPLYFETPKLKTISGIVQSGNVFYMDLELSQQTDNSNGKFYDFLVNNDNKNIATCHENANLWFGNIMPLTEIEKLYKSSILSRPDGQVPVLRVQVPMFKGGVQCEIFNDRKELITDGSFIEGGDFIVGIVEFTGMQFMNSLFMGGYKIHKIKVFKDVCVADVMPSGYLFSDVNEKIKLDLENDVSASDASILDLPVVDNSDIKNKHKDNALKNIEDVLSSNKDMRVDDAKLTDIIINATLDKLITEDEIFNHDVNVKKDFARSIDSAIENSVMEDSKRSATPVVYSTIEEIPELPVELDVNRHLKLDENGVVVGIGDDEIGDGDNDIDSDEDIEENDFDVQSSEEEEDGIDYNTLNDLEVVVFE